MAARWDRMTAGERAAAADRVARTERINQGLPEVCDDPMVLGKVARLVAGAAAGGHDLEGGLSKRVAS